MTEIEKLTLMNQYTIMKVMRIEYLRWVRDKIGLDRAKKELQELGLDEQIKKTFEVLGERTD